MYHLFGYDHHYRRGHHHGGGMTDYMGSFDTLDDLKKFAPKHKREEYEVVVQKGGDYISPAKLVQIESGNGIENNNEFTIYWISLEENDPRNPTP